jgi:two-component system, OmpR family, response regulator
VVTFRKTPMTTQPPRILLVEDDGSISKILAIAMQELGVPYHLDQAFSAEEGMELWEREPYDLLLTDYNLRGRSGLGLVADLKQQGVAIPTILFTAHDSAQIRREARTIGVTRFIAKPFIIEEFVNTVRSLLPVSTSKERGGETEDRR